MNAVLVLINAKMVVNAVVRLVVTASIKNKKTRLKKILVCCFTQN